MYKPRVERLLEPYASGRQEEAGFLFQKPWTIEVVGSWNLTKTETYCMSGLEMGPGPEPPKMSKRHAVGAHDTVGEDKQHYF